MDGSENEAENPINHQNWMKQTNWNFIKYANHHRHYMTPEQLKQKHFKDIIKKQHEKLDTEEGESNQDEEKSTTSSDMPEQDSETDTSTEYEGESKSTETPQFHNVLNNIMHDEHNSIHDEDRSSEPEDDTSDENSVNEIETPINNEKQKNIHEDKHLTTNFEINGEN